MKQLLVFVIALFFIRPALAQDARSICIKINQLNTAVLNNTIKKPQAAKQFKTLIGQLNKLKGVPKVLEPWVFPLKGYNYHAIGGTNGNGYSYKGYNYLDGNKHSAHPAQDIFINDKNQDCLDDKTHKPVDVLAVNYGYVIASSNTWDTTSTLRGGKYIWIYDDDHGLTYYAHNNSIFVKPGDRVTQGQKIAEVGRTGYNAYKKRSPTHLHFSNFSLNSGIPKPVNPYHQLKNFSTSK
jgi:hypothetical protein